MFVTTMKIESNINIYTSVLEGATKVEVKSIFSISMNQNLLMIVLTSNKYKILVNSFYSI